MACDTTSIPIIKPDIALDLVRAWNLNFAQIRGGVHTPVIIVLTFCVFSTVFSASQKQKEGKKNRKAGRDSALQGLLISSIYRPGVLTCRISLKLKPSAPRDFTCVYWHHGYWKFPRCTATTPEQKHSPKCAFSTTLRDFLDKSFAA